MTLASTCDLMQTRVFRDDLIRRQASTYVPYAHSFFAQNKKDKLYCCWRNV